MSKTRLKGKDLEKRAEEFVEKQKMKTAKAILDEKNQQYFLSMLDVFEQSMLKQIDINAESRKGIAYKPIDLFNMIMLYFRSCIGNGINLSKMGISLFCQMDKAYFNRMIDNMDKHPEYKFLNYCIDFVEMYMETTAQEKTNPAFQIFWLKNRGWKDKFEVEASTTKGALTEDERQEAQRRAANFSEGVFLEEMVKEK
jgi:hypothetical protein